MYFDNLPKVNFIDEACLYGLVIHLLQYNWLSYETSCNLNSAAHM